MLKGTLFAQSVSENEVLLKNAINWAYKTANSILSKHPLYKYFEKYLGGYLIVMEPDGTILTSSEDEMFTSSQMIGYIHPLDREKYYESGITKAQSLCDNDHVRSFDVLSDNAGAIKLNSGLIFSYSGFEFLELKDREECDSYEDIFETINLYTLLTSEFFRPETKIGFNPHRYDFRNDQETEKNILREEILFSMTQDELIDIATKISTTGLQYNFSFLNEIFLSKILLETGFIDIDYMENIIKAGPAS